MDRETVDDCLRAIDLSGAHTVDLTGGAPELNPHFRYLVDECVRRGKHVIDRCNLTILTARRFADLPEWMAERGVEVVCSLPHYRQSGTDAQRGEGAYTRSIAAIRKLNEVGYGQGDADRHIDPGDESGRGVSCGQPAVARTGMEGGVGAESRDYVRSPDCAQQYADVALPRMAGG